PFAATITANGLDKLINNHTLYNSWLWSRAALVMWVMVLPALAFTLALASYLLFVATNKSKQSFWRRVVDIRHTWPVLITGIIGLGIVFMLLFHDSAHCWVQNPVYFATKWHQTWQCTTSGFLGGK